MDQAAADKVKQIREYLSKMTPGEWIFEKRAYDGSVHYAIRTVEKFAAHPWSPRFIASLCGSLGEYIHNRPLGDYRNDPEIEADADGICKLRTDAEWLLSQLSASEERVRWIPISERLPEEDQTVLTAVPFYTNGKLVEVAIEHCRYYEGGRTCGQKIFVTCEGEEYEHTEVTAWMPLPSPPQVEETK